MSENRAKKLISNSIVFAISDISSKMILFFLVPLYTNALTAEQYSISDLITITVSLLSPFFTLVISEAVMRFSLDTNENPKVIFSVGVNIVVFGSLILAIISYFVFQCVDILRDYWILFILYYGVTNLYGVATQILKGINRLKLLAVSGIITTISMVLLNILFLLCFKMDVVGYLLAYIISTFLGLLITVLFGKLYYYYTLPRNIPKGKVTEMLKYSMPMIPNSAMWWINNSSDRYLVTYLVSAAANGIYSIAYKIPSVFNVIVSVFMQAWQISVVEDFESEQGKKFYNQIYGYYVQTNIIVCAILIVFIKLIASFLFANEFFAAWKYSIPLIIGYSFHSLAGFIGTIYTTLKKTKLLFWSTFIAATSNIILNIFLIKRISTMGAAVATLVSYFIAYIIRRTLARQYINFTIPTSKFVMDYLLLLLMCVIMILDYKWSIYVSIVIFAVICISNYRYFAELIGFGLRLVKSR